MVCSCTKSQQIDLKHLLFAHFIIADNASELKNCTFTEIVSHTFYLLYSITESQLKSVDFNGIAKLSNATALLKYLDYEAERSASLPPLINPLTATATLWRHGIIAQQLN